VITIASVNQRVNLTTSVFPTFSMFIASDNVQKSRTNEIYTQKYKMQQATLRFALFDQFKEKHRNNPNEY